jgi:hypothetical protein
MFGQDSLLHHLEQVMRNLVDAVEDLVAWTSSPGQVPDRFGAVQLPTHDFHCRVLALYMRKVRDLKAVFAPSHKTKLMKAQPLRELAL